MKFVKNYTNLLILLTFLANTKTHADPCSDIVQKVVKPPPAIAIIDTQQGYRLLDPKERYEIAKTYRQDIQRITELLGKYIQLRKHTEQINAFLGWQWKRVEVGIEYKKDIWKEQIELQKLTTELLNVEKQLYMLGVNPKDLEACYKNAK